MTYIDQYPNFGYQADQLNKFLVAADIVTIQLKNGHIIHHSPQNLPDFINWLNRNAITDIKKN